MVPTDETKREIVAHNELRARHYVTKWASCLRLVSILAHRRQAIRSRRPGEGNPPRSGKRQPPGGR